MAAQPIYNVSKKYNAILQAGEVLFCEGYESAQPLAVTKKAGVSVGLFYRYFENKQALLAAIMVRHLNVLHAQISQDIQYCGNAMDALECVLVSTLRYFRQHQGLIKLFFMEIGYGDAEATQQLKVARQTYRKILGSILKEGSSQGIFLDAKLMDVEIAINSIVGTINWTLYDLLVVQNKNIKPDNLATRMLAFLSRSLCEVADRSS